MPKILSSAVAFACIAAAAGGCSDEAGTGGSAGSTGSKSALPCDVAPIIEAACLSCHGDPPSSSAPQSLLTVAQWKAASPTDPSKSNGERSVERMNDAARPMPPSGLLAATDIEVVATWVAAGMPGGECDPTTVVDPILDAEPTCTSMDFWPAGEDEAPGKSRPEMMPGMPCNDCHTNPQKYGFNDGSDPFDIAGTVFPSGHEPDYCAGLDGTSVTDVVVQIEDATGKTWDLHPNAAGNFTIKNGVTYPYSARVVSSTGVRAMSYQPLNGDCNICHTQEGSNGGDPNSPVAPGRITVPAP
jgi:hypothetical protein